MSIAYKLDIMQALKNKGFTSYKLRNDKLLSESTMQKLRQNDNKLTFNNLNTICKLLNCQPGDILEYIPDDADTNNVNSINSTDD